MTAVQSIKDSLSLSEYGIGYQRLWERTSGLKGSETEAAFQKTLQDLEKKKVIELKGDRYYKL